MREYNVRELGPWVRDDDKLFSAPDPFCKSHGVWWDMNNGCYMDSSGVPLHFAGTEPRRRGYPPLEDEGDVGTPFAQWELELRGSSPDAWYHYRNTGEW